MWERSEHWLVKVAKLQLQYFGHVAQRNAAQQEIVWEEHDTMADWEGTGQMITEWSAGLRCRQAELWRRKVTERSSAVANILSTEAESQ